MNRKKYVYAVIEAVILAVVAGLAFTVLNIEYLFQWAAHNWKFYLALGLITLLLIFLNQQFVSVLMTAGIVVGIFAGNYLGRFIKGLNEGKIMEGMKAEEVYRLQHNPGFEIWMGVILVSVVIGIVIQIIVTRKRREG